MRVDLWRCVMAYARFLTSLNTFLVVVIFLPSLASAQWTRTSGPISLNPVALLSVVALGDTIFAGAYESGGIYRSKDGGTTWKEVAPGGEFSYLNALAIHSNIVYAGNYNGVYHSSDFGETWIKNA